MPYVSDRQRRFMHAQKGKKVPAEVVEKFDKEERKKKKEKEERKKKKEKEANIYTNLRKLIK